MRTTCFIALAGLAFLAAYTSAQSIAIEPLGFHTLAGPSSDGTFTVSGIFTPAHAVEMNSGDFAIAGDFRSATAVVPITPEELIVNGSFENTANTFVPDAFGLMSLTEDSDTIPGWTIRFGELAWVDNTNSFGASTPFGVHSLDLTGYHDYRPYGGVSQGIATVPGRRYRLSLSLGSHVNYAAAKVISVCAGSTSAFVTLAPTNTSGSEWRTFTFTFTATDETTEIAIQGILGGAYIGLDNVSVVADPSPGPSESSNLVVNGSFEATCPVTFLPDGQGIMSLQPGATDIPGWTTTTAEIAWGLNGNAFSTRSPYGSFFVDLTGYHDSPPYGGITQDITTTPGQQYQLTFSLGSHEGVGAYRGPVAVSVMAGAASNTFTFTAVGAGNQWDTFTMDFRADSTSTPLTFEGRSAMGGAYLGIDNITVLPHDAPLRIGAARVSGDTFRLEIDSATGWTYSIESRASLETGEWQTVPGTETSGTGHTVEIVIPDLFSRPQQYFRVKATR